jgi:PRTRC genetic system protein B
MDLLSKFTEQFKPTIAIIGYQGCEDSMQQWYFESHPIVNGVYGEGRPLQTETLNGMLELMYSDHETEMKLNRFIPHNLLYYDMRPGGDYRLIWYHPEQRRTLLFVKNLELQSGEAWVPAMVYVAGRKNLMVYSLNSNDYPTEESKLYIAPFHNVSNGVVCLGSAKAKKPKVQSLAALMAYHEELFWNSNFSHMSGGNFTKKTPGNLVWKRLLADASVKWSDIDELKPMNKQLTDLLK